MGVSILYPLSGSYINRPREQTTVTFCKYRVCFVLELYAHIRFFRACLQRDEGMVEGIHLSAPPYPIPTARQLRSRPNGVIMIQLVASKQANKPATKASKQPCQRASTQSSMPASELARKLDS